MIVKSTVFDLELSGALGNVVAGRDRAGQIWLRSRVTPSNPQSTSQSIVRNLIAALSGVWKDTLTQANRDAWDAYADAVLKNGLKLTGANWFTGSNLLRGQVNAEQPGDPLDTSRVDAGPTTLSQASLSPVTVTASVATGLISVAFTGGEGWDGSDDDGCLLVYASPSISPSRTYNNQGYKFAGAIISASGGITSPQTVTAPYTLVEDNKLFVRVRSLQADGRYSPEQLRTVTIDA